MVPVMNVLADDEDDGFIKMIMDAEKPWNKGLGTYAAT